MTLAIGDALVLGCRFLKSCERRGVAGEEIRRTHTRGQRQRPLPREARSPRVSTWATCPPSTWTRAGLPIRTSPPRASINRRAGSAYSSSSGHVGRPRRRMRGLRRRTCEPARRQTAVRRLSGSTDSAQRARAAPTASRAIAVSGRSGRATARPFRPARPRRGSPSALWPLPSALSARSVSAAAMFSAASRSRHPSASQSKSPPRRLKGAGSGGNRSRLLHACAIDELDIQIWLHQDAIICAQLPQERERLLVTSHQHVLAVVDPLAGLRIVEGRRPAAEHGL